MLLVSLILGAAGPAGSPIPTRSLFEMLLAGGPVMIPIALASFLMVLIVFERMISLKLLLVRPLLFAVPGLVLLAITMCTVDYARAQLVVGERRGAIRALLGGFRFVFRNPGSLAHYGLYLLFWAAVSALYVTATFGHPFAGAGGAWALLALRQLVSLVRFGARVATTGGQVALVLQASAPPSVPSS